MKGSRGCGGIAVARAIWLNSFNVVLLWFVFIACLRKHSAVTQPPKGNTGHIIRQLTAVLHATVGDSGKEPDTDHSSLLKRIVSLFTCKRKAPKCPKLLEIIKFVLCVRIMKIPVLDFQDRVLLPAARRK